MNIRVKDILEIVASCAVIAGAPLFLLQQNLETRASRVAGAMQFINIYNSGDVAAVKMKVSKAWLNIDMGAFASQNPSPAAIAKMKQDVVATAGITTSDLIQMTDFYNSVLSCRTRDICDGDTIDAYFHDSIVGFYCTYDDALARTARSLNRPNYLDTIRAYVGGCDGPAVG
jgi:hypothetical protein